MVRDVWATPKCRATAVLEAHERQSRVALTVTWMAATLTIALFVPDIGKVIELIGGISAFFIFIFPGKNEQWEGWVGSACGGTPRWGLAEGCRGGGAEPLLWRQGCAWCA